MDETRGYLAREGGERLAFRQLAGDGPTVVWLSGYRSDMTGTKAEAVAEWAGTYGRACVRFDYFGHGESSGDFLQGSITRWREDALAVIDRLTQGRLVLVGSSMGGWIACLAAMARPERLRGLVLIAPAPDFTTRLMPSAIPPEGLAAIDADGVWLQPSPYGDPNPITRTLLEDGDRWSILDAPVPITAPVRILQGGEDPDVPWAHSLELAQALQSRDVVFTLIKDGDHRLSRPQDIARLLAALGEVAG